MEKWRGDRTLCLLMFLFLLYDNLELCVSLNDEGRVLLRFKEMIEMDPFGSLWNWNDDDDGSAHPCSWFGIHCSPDGRVVALHLNDLGLKGKLASELGSLTQMQIFNLHNNSFYGTIPKEIGDLNRLKVLDLGHNNLSGTVPSELKNFLSLEFLLLSGNEFSGALPPELHDLNMLCESQSYQDPLFSNSGQATRNTAKRRHLLEINQTLPGKRKNHKTPHTAPSPSPSPNISPSLNFVILPPQVAPSNNHGKKRMNSWVIYVSIGGALCFAVVALLVTYLLCARLIDKDGSIIMPWATGLSGHLQKAFVTGMPLLKRSEIEAACEDFSNIILTLSECVLYKGTLSNGSEITVMSSLTTSAGDWSDQSETHFRNKILVLSKINHKNFMNLVGYCEESEPFSRMMVFEYAPNGTLFEHLHIKEAEQLDWTSRLRIAMGVIYCLEYIQTVNPNRTLETLNSSSIYLTEDYAAKVSDVRLHAGDKDADSDSEEESPAYKFGLLLLEIISGRLPFSKDDGLLVLWASSYLNGKRPVMSMVDPTLKDVPEMHIIVLCDLIRSCINPVPKERPGVADVAGRMHDITGMSPDAVVPRLSPLWWAELEIVSS